MPSTDRPRARPRLRRAHRDGVAEAAAAPGGPLPGQLVLPGCDVAPTRGRETAERHRVTAGPGGAPAAAAAAGAGAGGCGGRRAPAPAPARRSVVSEDGAGPQVVGDRGVRRSVVSPGVIRVVE